jgi:hypothetical protein
VDVQGAELDVLRGGTSVLKNLKLIELEVEFNYQYKGQALFSEIDLFLRKHGYALLGLRRSFWRHRESVDRGKTAGGGHLVHGDVLYYNAAELEPTKPLTTRDLAAWLLLLGAYRQSDFVLHLLEAHPASRSLSDTDNRLIQRTLIVQPTAARRLVRALLAPIVNDVGHVGCGNGSIPYGRHRPRTGMIPTFSDVTHVHACLHPEGRRRHEMSVRDFSLRFYWKAQSVMVPGLQYAQTLYEHVLWQVTTGRGAWLELGCGHQVLPHGEACRKSTW